MSTPPYFIFSENALPLDQRVLEQDSYLAPGETVIGTFVNERLIGRYAGDADDRVSAEPRAIVYVGFGITPEAGLTAHLFAQIPHEREPWEPEPEVPEFELVFLGVLVRVPQELKGLDPEAEYIDHFREVMAGNATSVIDRMLPHL